MSADKLNLRELQAPIKELYRENPEEAVVTMRVRSSASDLTDPLHCAVRPDSAPNSVWSSGAHPAAGGVGDVPCSADFLLGALVACQEVTLRMVAAAMGIELESLEISASGTMDFRGTLGMSRETPVGLSGIECEVDVVLKGDADAERAERFLQNAERYCVVLDTLRKGVPVESSFHVTQSA